MTAFSLRFEGRELPHWAAQYSDDDSGVEKVAARTAHRGWLTKQDFLELCEWKSKRVVKLYSTNTDDLVEEASRTAFAAVNERLKIGILTTLKGVGWPMASVLLHFGPAPNYPILDYRALWSVGSAVPTAYTFEFWWAYTLFCRGLAERTRLTMRMVDRALWQYARDHQASAPQ